LNLPICHSTFSAAGLIDVIKAAYGFPDVQCEMFMPAFGDIYQVVTAQARFILRIYHAQGHTRSAILSEVELLNYLYQHELSVSHPLRRLDGEWLLTLQAPEGVRYAVLYSYAEGEPVSASTGLDSIVQYGELVARIHTTADSIPIRLDRQPITFASLVDDGLERLSPLRPHLKDAIAYLREAADVIRPRIAMLPTTTPLYGICHGDSSPTNVHIAPDGHPTLFDFDIAGPCWRIYDVGAFISHVAYKKLPGEFSDAFLEGYERVRKLEPIERSAIPLIKILRKYLTISVITLTIEPFGGRYLSDSFITDMVEHIKAISLDL
jgi:Ser/Thr protein kinase RdoA (MazF antagonist)